MRGLGNVIAGVEREAGLHTKRAVLDLDGRVEDLQDKVSSLPPRALAEPVKPNAFVATNANNSRSFDATTVTTPQLADVVATLIADLKAAKIVG